jgi:hypothetical protein
MYSFIYRSKMNIYNDDTIHAFHQTPESLCKDIISNIEWKENEIVLEPFSGTDGFYNNLPPEVIKYRCEIRDNLDYRMFDYEGIKPHTIISNPPYDLGENDRKRKNDFYNIVLFFSKKPYIKRIIFLCNAYCFNSLTAKRMMELNSLNTYITKITSVRIRKWHGAYYVVEFGRQYNPCFDYYLGNYE